MGQYGNLEDGLEVVTFEECSIDPLENARNRLLWQFRNSCVIDQLIQAVSCEVQELIDVACDMLTQRLLINATGVQLDALGDIVGQGRISPLGVSYEFLGEPSTTLDNSPLFVTGAPEYSSTAEADDTDYLAAITRKIFKNHTQFCSYPEVANFIYMLTGINVSFNRVAPLDIEIIVPVDTTDEEINGIMSIVEVTQEVDSKYHIPIAATVRIYGARRLVEDLFAPDETTGRPDYAVASVTGFLT